MTTGRNRTPVALSRVHRVLIGVVVVGALVIAAIGFAGSYTAVRELALHKGFGTFSYVFPIGIDAGIVVLLALDLLLTWIRIPFPLLRQTAWLLTAATIAFNGAAAWPDPLGVGMHAVIPVLFVVAVEAARHAIGRIADVTVDRHMEGVRPARWLLDPIASFLLWRRMKLWEIRSYEQVLKLEQERLVYQTQLRARYGRGWRRKAPVESLMPLRLARYGVPLAETGPGGLAAAGITRPVLAAEPEERQQSVRAEQAPVTADQSLQHLTPAGAAAATELPAPAAPQDDHLSPATNPSPSVEPPHSAPVAAPVVSTAFDVFVDQHGIYPTARQLALVLHDTYGVTDPQTGGPLTEQELRPLLRSLKQERDAGEAVTERVMTNSTVTESAMTDATVTASTSTLAEDSGAPHPAPVAEPAPALAMAADRTASGMLPEQLPLSPSMPPAHRAGEAPAGEWQAAVNDTGAATALAPESHTAEEELSEEEQRIRAVIELVKEAEASPDGNRLRDGKKLSGAEVARRLEVSPSTGQRALREARQRHQMEQRETSRSRLRSVGDSR